MMNFAYRTSLRGDFFMSKNPSTAMDKRFRSTGEGKLLKLFDAFKKTLR